MIAKFAKGICCLAAISGAGCVTTNDIQIEHQEDAPSNPAYDEAMHKASKHQTIYRDFETKYAVTVSYFSKEFTAAFQQRATQVFMQQSTILEKYHQHHVFFISIYVPTASYFDLTDTKLWTIKLRCGQQDFTPVEIVAIKEKKHKAYWQSFFPYISSWSKEYLVPFAHEAGSDPCRQLPLEMVMANVDAKVTMTWKAAKRS